MDLNLSEVFHMGLIRPSEIYSELHIILSRPKAASNDSGQLVNDFDVFAPVRISKYASLIYEFKRRYFACFRATVEGPLLAEDCPL